MPKCNVTSRRRCDTRPQRRNEQLLLPGLDPTDAQRFDIRVDWIKSEKQRIFGRFSFDRLFTSTFNAFGNMWDLNYAQNVTNGRNFLLADDFTLNPTTVLQLRYSFTRHYENQGGDPRQVGFDITTLGFPSSLASEEVYKLLPFVIFNDVGGGVGGTANYNTFRYASENNDASASITKLLGKHEISAGFEYMKRFLNVGQPPAASGSYAFDISATDQNVSASDHWAAATSPRSSWAWERLPGSESDSYPNFTKDLFAAEANPYYAAFVEDTYHPTKTLTSPPACAGISSAARRSGIIGLSISIRRLQHTVNGVSYTGAEIYASSGKPLSVHRQS